MFGSKKTVISILMDTQNNIFKIYGVTRPTDAQKMKASFYLCISGIAILNDLMSKVTTGERLRHAIEALGSETQQLAKSYGFIRVNELSNNEEQLKEILAQFPEHAKVTGETQTDGHTAFQALYFSIGQELMANIMNAGKGPNGPQRYAGIVVTDGIFGDGKSIEHLLAATTELYSFTKELASLK